MTKAKLVALAAIDPKDFQDLYERVEIINREVGEVVGELRTLKWLVGAILFPVWAYVILWVVRMVGVV